LRIRSSPRPRRRPGRGAATAWRLPSGAIVEGNVDLAYLSGEEIVVIDFKTDRELEGALDRYRRQVQVYASAIGAAMGRPARPVLMKI
jgi:ATP-dependent exoDNAse (exonuclease V) beta subunit